MTKKIPQTEGELESQFQEQLRFIRRSAAHFDDGEVSEAKRIAVALRVLLHQTDKSHSLLTLTHRTEQRFYSSIEPDDADNILPYTPLVALVASTAGSRVVPRLDDYVSGSERSLSFSEWWGEVVYRDKRGRKQSRRTLTLAVANQDGGAHVDPGLDPTYHALSRGPGVDVSVAIRGEVHELSGTELASVRQIGHELLKTFDPALIVHRRPMPGDSIAMLQPRVTIPGMGPFIRSQNDAFAKTGSAPKPGRNDPCPCGSGRKWKKCHGVWPWVSQALQPFVRVK